MINCERAGIKRFVVAAPRELYPDVARAMGRFNGSDSVSMVESFSEILNHRNADGLGIDPSSPCVSFSGNLVIAKSQLVRILGAHASNPRSVHRAVSTDRGLEAWAAKIRASCDFANTRFPEKDTHGDDGSMPNPSASR